MPDFFDGKPVPLDYFPPDNKEKEEFLGNFFQTQAAPPKTLERVPNVVRETQEKHKGVQAWGVVGYCWGGKIANLLAGENSQFYAAAACHPAMVDANDAKKITIPFAMLPSKDESKEDVDNWEKNCKTDHTVEWFNDQVHGFMAARGDLKQEGVKKEYQRGYKILLDFFCDKL